MGHVAHIVGGVYAENKHVGQKGVLYTPVPGEHQRAAVKFLGAMYQAFIQLDRRLTTGDTAANAPDPLVALPC